MDEDKGVVSYFGFNKTNTTESPRKNIFEMTLDRSRRLALSPLADFECSTQISVTSYKT